MNRSLAIALGIAAIAHAIAIAVVRPRVRQPVAPSVVVDSQDVFELVALAPVEPVVPPKSEVAPGAPLPTPHVAVVTPQAKGSPETTAIAVPPMPSGELVAPPSGSVAPSEPAKVATKFPSLINLDAPGSHAVIFPSSSADVPISKEKAAAAKLDAQLKSALDAKATETGSGFGGPVVSAAHATADGSNAMGWAAFDVSTDAMGTVTMVRVVDFGGGDAKAWQSVAKGIHSTLGSTRLKVPSGAGGVAVRIRVEATMKYPSGATTPLSPTIGAGSVGGEFDLADIGQSKRRVVSVRIIAEQRI